MTLAAPVLKILYHINMRMTSLRCQEELLQACSTCLNWKCTFYVQGVFNKNVLLDVEESIFALFCHCGAAATAKQEKYKTYKFWNFLTRL